MLGDLPYWLALPSFANACYTPPEKSLLVVSVWKISDIRPSPWVHQQLERPIFF